MVDKNENVFSKTSFGNEVKEFEISILARLDLEVNNFGFDCRTIVKLVPCLISVV